MLNNARTRDTEKANYIKMILILTYIKVRLNQSKFESCSYIKYIYLELVLKDKRR